MKIPYAEQLKEIRRELAVRARVYPRWVSERRISQAEADRKTAVLQAVAETLAELAKTEELL